MADIYWKGEKIESTLRLIEIIKEEMSAAWDAGYDAAREAANDRLGDSP